MSLDLDAFRGAMGRFATGVTVVTTLDGSRPVGITVNALASVSLEPPLVAIALDRRRRIIPALRATGRFAVNILGEDQQALSDCFAGAPVVPDREAFCGAAWETGRLGLPCLDGAVAVLECRLETTVPLGDHELHVGRVEAVREAAGDGLPLLYHRRRYLRLERTRTAEVDGTQEG